MKQINLLNDLLIPSLILISLDAAFIIMNQRMYATQVAKVQRVVMKPKLSSAVICYIFLIVGLYYFIIKDKKNVIDAMLLGFIIYGVYAFTVLTMFKKWSLELAILDTMWGGVLFSVTTGLTYYLTGQEKLLFT